MTTLIQKQRELFNENLTKTVLKYGFLADVPEDFEPIDFNTDSIYSFLTTCLIEHYEEDIRELEGNRKELPKTKCINAENHLFGSCFQCEKIKGFNSALDLAISLLQDKIKELKK